jgi:hypothetical protein
MNHYQIDAYAIANQQTFLGCWKADLADAKKGLKKLTPASMFYKMRKEQIATITQAISALEKTAC